jgi:starvation-inducible outer membrane lipoprotein
MRLCFSVCVCLWARACLCIPPIVARQRLRKNPLIVDRQRLGKNLLIVARQRLGRKVTTVTNTHATIEELLGASFSMWPVSCEGK